MKKRAMWALGVIGIILVFVMIISTMVNVVGANYMNPDKKINWVEVGWGVAGALVAYFCFTEISKSSQRRSRKLSSKK